MGQKEYGQYYERVNPVSFGDQAFAYRRAMAYLARQNPSIQAPTEPKTFILGGFHPNTDTPESFITFAQSIHPNPNDRHLLLDQNPEPLQSRNNPEQYPNRLIAALEASPFGPSSIDFLVLDGTLNFMNADQVRQFAEGASNFLSRDGLILATIKDVPNNPLYRLQTQFLLTAANRVNQHPHTNENLAYLTQGKLKPVLYADFKVGFKHMRSIVTFSRIDSHFQQHSGDPFFYSRD